MMLLKESLVNWVKCSLVNSYNKHSYNEWKAYTYYSFNVHTSKL